MMGPRAPAILALALPDATSEAADGTDKSTKSRQKRSLSEWNIYSSRHSKQKRIDTSDLSAGYRNRSDAEKSLDRATVEDDNMATEMLAAISAGKSSRRGAAKKKKPAPASTPTTLATLSAVPTPTVALMRSSDDRETSINKWDRSLAQAEKRELEQEQKTIQEYHSGRGAQLLQSFCGDIVPNPHEKFDVYAHPLVPILDVNARSAEVAALALQVKQRSRRLRRTAAATGKDVGSAYTQSLQEFGKRHEFVMTKNCSKQWKGSSVIPICERIGICLCGPQHTLFHIFWKRWCSTTTFKVRSASRLLLDEGLLVVKVHNVFDLDGEQVDRTEWLWVADQNCSTWEMVFQMLEIAGRGEAEIRFQVDMDMPDAGYMDFWHYISHCGLEGTLVFTFFELQRSSKILPEVAPGKYLRIRSDWPVCTISWGGFEHEQRVQEALELQAKLERARKATIRRKKKQGEAKSRKPRPGSKPSRSKKAPLQILDRIEPGKTEDDSSAHSSRRSSSSHRSHSSNTSASSPRGPLTSKALVLESVLRSVEVANAKAAASSHSEAADNNCSGQESGPSDDLSTFFGELLQKPPPPAHELVTPPVPEHGFTWDSSDDFFDTKDATLSTDREGTLDHTDMDPGEEVETEAHSSPGSMTYQEEWGLSDYRSDRSNPCSPSGLSDFTSGPFLDQDCSSVSPALSDMSDTSGHLDAPRGRLYMLTGKVN